MSISECFFTKYTQGTLGVNASIHEKKLYKLIDYSRWDFLLMIAFSIYDALELLWGFKLIYNHLKEGLRL
jgi:hypothetical protein